MPASTKFKINLDEQNATGGAVRFEQLDGG
jgi:hypothetical protein